MTGRWAQLIVFSASRQLWLYEDENGVRFRGKEIGASVMGRPIHKPDDPFFGSEADGWRWVRELADDAHANLERPTTAPIPHDRSH